MEKSETTEGPAWRTQRKRGFYYISESGNRQFEM